MKSWIKDRTTWIGLILMVVAALQAYRTGGDMVTAVIAAAGIAGLVVRDRKQ
jgi:small-conductance mechanosensitive channel